jgi:hypothetical protein
MCMCGVYDMTERCVWELIMQYDAFSQRSLHRWDVLVA